MLEAVALFVAITGIARLARARGVSAKLAGGLAFFGWLAVRLAGMLLSPNHRVGLYFLVVAWIWIALVAVYLRFRVVPNRPEIG